MPSMRARASSTSRRLGAVPVFNLENLLHDLPNRRQWVELAPLHLVEQPPQLGIILHRALEVRLRPRRRDREDLACEVAPPPLVEPAVRDEELAVPLDLVPHLRD